MPAVRVLIAVALTFACAIAGAQASERVTLNTRLLPDQLGASTTLLYDFHIATPGALLPAPLLSVNLHLPAGMGLASSSLGLAVCEPAVLQERGPQACPAESHLGYGRALVKFRSPTETIEETGAVSVLLGPPQNEHVEVLFYVEGREPVEASLVFPGEVRGDTRPFGTRLDTKVPLTPVWPEGPDLIVTSFNSTIGPRHLTYYRHVHGGVVPFHPRGIAIPLVCPRGGFPFAADFAFADGTQVQATSHVPCPTARTVGRKPQSLTSTPPP
jgi:hypothetical protein